VYRSGQHAVRPLQHIRVRVPSIAFFSNRSCRQHFAVMHWQLRVHPCLIGGARDAVAPQTDASAKVNSRSVVTELCWVPTVWGAGQAQHAVLSDCACARLSHTPAAIEGSKGSRHTARAAASSSARRWPPTERRPPSSRDTRPLPEGSRHKPRRALSLRNHRTICGRKQARATPRPKPAPAAPLIWTTNTSGKQEHKRAKKTTTYFHTCTQANLGREKQ
jgi:hypothetical protein